MITRRIIRGFEAWDPSLGMVVIMSSGAILRMLRIPRTAVPVALAAMLATRGVATDRKARVPCYPFNAYTR